jgi:uncharacterized protein (DUF983 family)
MKKGSKLYSILKMKCPRCHEGAFFKSPNPYDLKRAFHMYETCPNCGLRYEIEPAFFYGAMYVSYGFGVAIFVTTYMLMQWLYTPSILEIILVLSGIMLLSSPFIFRLARITYLNLFVKYNPEKRGAKK